MSRPRRSSAVQMFFLSVWAMGTLILIFVLVLLVREMVSQGQDPLGFMATAPEGQAATGARPNPAMPVAPREVALYFASADARGLVAEMQTIDLTTSTVENCRAALKKLISGPSEGLVPVLPPAVRVRAIYLLDNGELVVDFSRELQQAHVKMKSASLELLLVYSIANTLTQTALQGEVGGQVRRVRILIEGLPPQDVFPGHVEVDEPIAPDSRWVVPGQAPAGNA